MGATSTIRDFDEMPRLPHLSPDLRRVWCMIYYVCVCVWFTVQRYRGGSVIIYRFHHCMADGIAMLRIILAALDPLPVLSFDINLFELISILASPQVEVQEANRQKAALSRASRKIAPTSSMSEVASQSLSAISKVGFSVSCFRC